MADGPARVAAVGLGRWAKTLAGAIQKSAKIKIVNCFSRSEKSRQDFAQQYKCRSAKSYADLLSDPEVEGVIVTTPNDAHGEPIFEAAARGNATYVDKPIAHTRAEAIKTDHRCPHAGGNLSVGHSARRLAGHRQNNAI